MAKVDLKAKAKRQKIVAAVLGVLLLGVLVYEVPSVLKMMSAKPPANSSTAAPAPAPGPVPAAPGAAPATGTPVSAPSSTTLTDSDPTALPSSGQLVSFDRFTSKDPFVQQVGATTCVTDSTSGDAPACPTTAKTTTTTAKPTTPAVTPAPKAPKQPAAAPTVAKITVNGAASEVAVGQTFPSSDPVFVLRSLTKKTANIGIAGGSLATGNQTVTLTKGKKVTLMNTADGTRYELVLVSVA